MSHYLFVAGFCLLLVHEMDAVRLEEWKIFPLLCGMREESGYVTFAALHVPIYALLLLGLLTAACVRIDPSTSRASGYRFQASGRI
ncbi:hypothetical protein GBA63_11610 [Rubrobacter tropicus]|uniref:Uncharacterized protein n=1 Tax=Rubrobacter tropicus TaxID=2653851 RepID=A0A6G8Q9R9_9ACTN|nr:DUF6713 family protein [Rubrobacter tropicus]QIN83216.1 hypothetical protein GBA63_11610 [Rubrobacter tropicus]